jgi:response regulator NasT
MHARLGLALTELPERKLGERAKGLLLKEFGLDEPQAHTHLRKLAMDRGQRLGEVAERPIEAHQLLQPPA